MFEDVLRFWLDRGVDGFRVDVAHGLFKEESLRDQVVDADERPASSARPRSARMVERDAARRADVGPARGARRLPRAGAAILDEYDGDRMAVAEAWTQTPESMAALRPPRRAAPGLQLRLAARRLVGRRRSPTVIAGTLAALEPVGATPTWVLSNHDVVRHATRYGGGAVGPGPRPGRDADDAGAARLVVPLPGRGARPRAGRRRRRSSGRTRPGSAPASPAATAAGCRSRGAATQAPFGFGPGAGSRGSRSPPTGPALTVEAQTADPGSTLAFYRAALAARRTFADDGRRRRRDARPGARRAGVPPRAGHRRSLNCGSTAGRRCPPARCWWPAARSSPPPPGGRAGRRDDGIRRAEGLLLPPDTAVWLRPDPHAPQVPYPTAG